MMTEINSVDITDLQKLVQMLRLCSREGGGASHNAFLQVSESPSQDSLFSVHMRGLVKVLTL